MDPHPTHDSYGPSEPTTQTASLSVQPSLHRRPYSVPILYNGTPILPQKFATFLGGIWTPNGTSDDLKATGLQGMVQNDCRTLQQYSRKTHDSLELVTDDLKLSLDSPHVHGKASVIEWTFKRKITLSQKFVLFFSKQCLNLSSLYLQFHILICYHNGLHVTGLSVEDQRVCQYWQSGCSHTSCTAI